MPHSQEYINKLRKYDCVAYHEYLIRASTTIIEIEIKEQRTCWICGRSLYGAEVNECKDCQKKFPK